MLETGLSILIAITPTLRAVVDHMKLVAVTAQLLQELDFVICAASSEHLLGSSDLHFLERSAYNSIRGDMRSTHEQAGSRLRQHRMHPGWLTGFSGN